MDRQYVRTHKQASTTNAFQYAKTGQLITQKRMPQEKAWIDLSGSSGGRRCKFIAWSTTTAAVIPRRICGITVSYRWAQAGVSKG